MPGAERSVVINAPIDTVFDVIVDYEKYPEFLDDVSAVRVISRSDGAAVMEQTLDLIKKVTMKLSLTETRPTAVDWRLSEAGGMLKTNNGKWRLKDLGDGRTEALYGLEVAVGMWVPGRIVDKLTGTTLPKTLNAFKARAESLK